jgi:DNA-binding MarR family transcriptional regulator
VEKIENRIIIKIRRIVRSINIESKKIQRSYGVSVPQVLCLNFIKDQPNFQSNQKEIKNYLNLNASTVTGIVNRLERNGYVARLPKSGDKRVSNITLTVEGQKLLNNLPPLLQEELLSKLMNLPASEVMQIEDTLDKLINILDIHSVDASPVLITDEKISE